MYWFEVLFDVCLNTIHGIYPIIPCLLRYKKNTQQAKALQKLGQKSNLLVQHLQEAKFTRLHNHHFDPQPTKLVDELLPVNSYMDVEISSINNPDDNHAELMQKLSENSSQKTETRPNHANKADSSKPPNKGSSIQELLGEDMPPYPSDVDKQHKGTSSPKAQKIHKRRPTMDQVRNSPVIKKSNVVKRAIRNSLLGKQKHQGTCSRHPFNHYGPLDKRNKFKCNWSIISEQLWNLHLDTDPLFKKIPEPDMTSPDFETRLILVLISIARKILDTDVGYLPFLDTLIKMLLKKFITSKQIIDILIDIHYMMHCSGELLLSIENDILYMTLFYIGQYQNQAWLANAYYRLHGITKERYEQMLVRINEVRYHTCYCRVHTLYPFLHGPMKRPAYTWYCTVARQVQNENGNRRGMMATDKRFVTHVTYDCINFMCNIPDEFSLAQEEEGYKDASFLEHPGFSDAQFESITEALKRNHPTQAEPEKEFALELMNNLKIAICPCRMHHALRNDAFAPYIQCPFNWSREEKQLISLKCQEIKKYTVTTPPPKQIEDTFQTVELSPYAYVPDCNIDHIAEYRDYFALLEKPIKKRITSTIRNPGIPAKLIIPVKDKVHMSEVFSSDHQVSSSDQQTIQPIVIIPEHDEDYMASEPDSTTPLTLSIETFSGETAERDAISKLERLFLVEPSTLVEEEAFFPPDTPLSPIAEHSDLFVPAELSFEEQDKWYNERLEEWGTPSSNDQNLKAETKQVIIDLTGPEPEQKLNRITQRNFIQY